ncbi:hypothetical protein [Caldanaerobius polysaccharolyticus]|uniref:hypothetical protein n=1 Tax=Caldanaerobius polysaccharolyticus TaxID=44256 RepID=UPI00047C0C79|nr:hypothetical protein [Caldanaerobius polysaccharolyticus]
MDQNGINLKELTKETAIAFTILSLYFILTGKLSLFYGFAIGHGMYIAGMYHLSHIIAHVLSLHAAHVVISKPIAFLSFGVRYGIAATILIIIIKENVTMFYGALIGIMLVISVIMVDSIINYLRGLITTMN